MSTPAGLMKSANAYGSPSSAAQTALCGDEPSSQTSGRTLPPGSLPSRAKRWFAGMRFHSYASNSDN